MLIHCPQSKNTAMQLFFFQNWFWIVEAASIWHGNFLGDLTNSAKLSHHLQTALWGRQRQHFTSGRKDAAGCCLVIWCLLPCLGLGQLFMGHGTQLVQLYPHPDVEACKVGWQARSHPPSSRGGWEDVRWAFYLPSIQELEGGEPGECLWYVSVGE